MCWHANQKYFLQYIIWNLQTLSWHWQLNKNIKIRKHNLHGHFVLTRLWYLLHQHCCSLSWWCCRCVTMLYLLECSGAGPLYQCYCTVQCTQTPDLRQVDMHWWLQATLHRVISIIFYSGQVISNIHLNIYQFLKNHIYLSLQSVSSAVVTNFWWLTCLRRKNCNFI